MKPIPLRTVRTPPDSLMALPSGGASEIITNDSHRLTLIGTVVIIKKKTGTEDAQRTVIAPLSAFQLVEPTRDVSPWDLVSDPAPKGRPPGSKKGKKSGQVSPVRKPGE